MVSSRNSHVLPGTEQAGTEVQWKPSDMDKQQTATVISLLMRSDQSHTDQGLCWRLHDWKVLVPPSFCAVWGRDGRAHPSSYGTSLPLNTEQEARERAHMCNGFILHDTWWRASLERHAPDNFLLITFSSHLPCLPPVLTGRRMSPLERLLLLKLNFFFFFFKKIISGFGSLSGTGRECLSVFCCSTKSELYQC